MNMLIKCVGVPGVIEQDNGVDPVGKYLKSYDPDAGHDEGGAHGHALWTDYPGRAMAFTDLGAAVDTWRMTSTCCPVRDDGKPNRPLTAYSVQFEPSPL